MSWRMTTHNVFGIKSQRWRENWLRKINPHSFSFYLFLMYISSKKGLLHVNPHVNRWSHFWFTKPVLDPNYWPPSKYFSVLHPGMLANPKTAYEALWTQCDFFSENSNSDIFGILWTYFVNGKLSFLGVGEQHWKPSLLMNIKHLAKGLAGNPASLSKRSLDENSWTGHVYAVSNSSQFRWKAKKPHKIYWKTCILASLSTNLYQEIQFHLVL